MENKNEKLAYLYGFYKGASTYVQESDLSDAFDEFVKDLEWALDIKNDNGEESKMTENKIPDSLKNCRLAALLAEKCSEASATALKIGFNDSESSLLAADDRLLLFEKLFDVMTFGCVLIGIEFDADGPYSTASIGKKIDLWKAKLQKEGNDNG